MTQFRYGERERGLARLAFRTFEPYHLVAYFGPDVDAARERLGIGWLGSYTGMRAAPLGPVPGPVVAATFFGFKASAITKAWGLALANHGLDALNETRTALVDSALTSALGERGTGRQIHSLADRLRSVVSSADVAGRALSAAYLDLPWPESPQLSLWQSATLWREWRGDGHNAALVTAGLRPLEALVLYDAGLRDLGPAAAGRGREFLQPTRKWTDEEWSSATDALAAEGLLTVSTDEAILTDSGAALRRSIEDHTDDAAASVWVGVDDAEEVLQAFRPYAKAVINQGILPGTTKK